MHIFIMLLLISLLILVHEAGHFFVARFFKIKVDRFGFGLPFGPTLWEKKIGDVTYCVHAFLLGGYVAFPDDDPDSEVAEDDPGRLMNKPVWQRACVISAGVIANAILAFVIVVGVVIFGPGIPTDNNKVFVQDFPKEISIAKEAGMEKGDQIIKIDGKDVRSFADFMLIVMANKADDGYVSENDANNQLKKIIEVNAPLFESYGYNVHDLTKEKLDIIRHTLVPDQTIVDVPKPAFEQFNVPDLDDPFIALKPLVSEGKLTSLELQLKNTITKNKFAGNGETTFGELAAFSADTKHLLDLTVIRNGKDLVLPVSPNDEGKVGFIRQVEKVYIPVTSVGQVLTGSWDYLYSKTELMVVGLYKIFTGQISLWDMHGIIAITKVGGDIIQNNGMLDAWLLTALISIDLAIVNLLPIPALDGGHLVFLILEKLRGRPVEEKYMEAAVKYGFMFLIGLMVFILFNDIVGIVTGKF